jgi:putative transposase
LKNPLEGYRRLTFMMLYADIVAVSPSSVWRVLGQAGLLKKWNATLTLFGQIWLGH